MREVFEMNRVWSISLLFGAIVVAACLPGDIRPEPSSVIVAVEGSDTALNG